VAELLTHTATVYARVAAVLRGRLREPPADWARPPAGPADLPGWFDAHLAELRAALAEVPSETPVWTWYPLEQHAGFWARRMTHETIIHRADAELAAGRDTLPHLDAALALDGIDEFIERFLVFDAVPDGRPEIHRVRVQTAGASWLITLAGSGLRFERDVAAAAELTIAGTPSHILYWLWGRLADTDVDIRGDDEVLRRFHVHRHQVGQ
jgi:uncharacterized protein (TIGR03083 family)